MSTLEGLTDLDEGVAALLGRLGPRVGDKGTPEPLEELGETESAVGLPEWLVTLLTTQPLCGVRVGLRIPEFEAEGLGPKMFEWASTELVLELNRDSYPGMYVYPYGYVAVGCGVEWAGNVLLLDLNTPRVPVFELWHDVSQDAEELVQALSSRDERVLLVAESLVEFFKSCLVEPPLNL